MFTRRWIPLAALVLVACQAEESMAPPAAPEGQPRVAGLDAILAIARTKAPAAAGAVRAAAIPATVAGGKSPRPSFSVGATVEGPAYITFSSPSGARAVNASGQAVGFEDDEHEGLTRAIRWSPANAAETLSPETPEGSAVAMDINDGGVAVGYVSEASGIFAVLWAPGSTTPVRLPVADVAGQQGATALNENGVMVGTGGSPSRALRWDAAGAHILPQSTATGAVATDVNESGTVAGYLILGPAGGIGETRRAVVWSAAGALTELGIPAGAASVSAYAINDAGQVVGQAEYRDALNHRTRAEAVVWSVSGVPTLLPGDSIAAAVDINAAGVIAGYRFGNSPFAGALGEGGPVLWVGGEVVPFPLAKEPGADFVGAGVSGISASQAVGYHNENGADNNNKAARWTFTITGACTAASITGQPQGQTLTLGQPLVLSVTADGTPTLTYQWARNGIPITGATGASYQVASTTLADAGSYTVTVTSGCGSVTSAAAIVAVRFAFGGFQRPVVGPGAGAPYAINRVKAGRAIPVKFTLGGRQGLNILLAGSPSSKAVACTLSDPAGGTPTRTAGASRLSYDRTSGQYRYTWKTEKSWAGTCRQFTLSLTDGSTHSLLFRFAR